MGSWMLKDIWTYISIVFVIFPKYVSNSHFMKWVIYDIRIYLLKESLIPKSMYFSKYWNILTIRLSNPLWIKIIIIIINDFK